MKKTVRDIDVSGKHVLVRVDFNVPLDKKGNITDDTRIREALPTIKYLIENEAKVILMSHLGRPKGQPDPKYSLDPVAKHLSELLNRPIVKTKDCIGIEAYPSVRTMKAGEVILLENVRYHAEEEKNTAGFVKELAVLGDIFVNDAFGTAHRAHASTAGLAEYLPAVAGFLMEKEISALNKVLNNPERPFVAIIGGAKVSDKIGVIENLMEKVDTLIIGGGMANTFLAAQGYELGKSLVEEDKLEEAKSILKKAAERNTNLLLPVDVVVADKFEAEAQAKAVSIKEIPSDWMALDIGPETREIYANAVREAKTVVWNGPMGVFEFDKFAVGTEVLAEAVAKVKGFTVIGGGDSVAAVKKLGVTNRISHISTGGGASLEFLEGKTLPGVNVLQDK